MTRHLTSALAILALMAGSTAPALAAPCKDAKGKFIKCPPKPVAKRGPCKDAKGRFVKCLPKPVAKMGPCKDAKGRFVQCR